MSKKLFDDDTLQKEANTIAMMVPTGTQAEVLLRRRVMVLVYDTLLYVRDGYENRLIEQQSAYEEELDGYRPRREDH